MREKTINEFNELLASSAPVPGGGGVSALVSALGAGLGVMVGRLTIGKKKYAEHEAELREISAECETLSAGADATAVYSDGVLSLGIPRGEQGERGETGAQGGAGYTPVRGTDYWTEADRQSVVTDVLAQLPYWTGGNY